MNWFKSIPIEIILKKIPKDHLSKINVIDVSKNCPFFSQNSDWRNIRVSNYEIYDGVNPLSSHIHTPHVIYTIVQSIQK